MRGFAVTLLLWVMGTMSRADAPREDSLMHEVVQGNNQFAIDIYARLRQQPGNLFLSPYSLSTALAMTYAGARGETAEQMAKVLHFDVTPDRLHPAFEALIRQVNENKSRPYRLSVANALWGQESDPFLPEFLRLLADRYGAGLRRVDFQFTEQARRTINTWVEEQTEGKIKDLLMPIDLLPRTSLVLTNAIYFKGDWASPFPKGATRDETFTVTGDDRVSVPMMHRAGHFDYLDGGGFRRWSCPTRATPSRWLCFCPSRWTA
jgi:serpin B